MPATVPDNRCCGKCSRHRSDSSRGKEYRFEAGVMTGALISGLIEDSTLVGVPKGIR
jgi:hypothetical protein